MKITIIVAIYNIEKYIEKCIQSLISQSYKNLEIILVDDGSSDNSAEICKKYETKDNRIQYLKKKNGGLSSARNFGIDNASGQYILFVDGDDYIRQDAIEILVAELSKNEYDILVYNYCVVYGTEIKNPHIKLCSEEKNKKYILYTNSACDKIFKTVFFKNNGIRFPEGIIYEDLAIIPSLAGYTDNIGFLEEYLYYYVQRSSSIMHIKEFNANRDDKFKALENLKKSFIMADSFEKFYSEIEYLYIKNLLIMYSLEIFPYSKKIYGPRIDRALSVMNNEFPNWWENTYLNKQSKLRKLYLYFLKNKMLMFAKIIGAFFNVYNKKK